VVAIKRLHAQLAKDPDFAAMFLDEARLASRIAHPNVVDVLDVLADKGELFLVMPYVHGDSLAHLLGRARADGSVVPLEVAGSIMSGVLQGLHAAHEARSEKGAPLHLVHRDVSPQNVLVGADGVVRVIDFGVAKAVGRARVTRDGTIRGKIAYMAPEQLQGEEVDRRSDVYAAGVVLWELLTGRPLFAADSDAATLTRALHHRAPRPSTMGAHVPAALDEVVLRATERTRSRRFATAREMASALEAAMATASAARVAEWVDELASDVLGARAAAIAQIEALPEVDESSSDTVPADAPVVTATSSSVRARPDGAGGRWSLRALGLVVFAGGLAGGAALLRGRSAPRAVGVVAATLPAQPVVGGPVDADAAASLAREAQPADASIVVIAEPSAATHPPLERRPRATGRATARGSASADPGAYQ
jgi:serine/threonine-protein kinase